MAVAIVLTGMAKWNTLGNAEPLAAVFKGLGQNWTAGVIAVGVLLVVSACASARPLGPSAAVIPLRCSSRAPSISVSKSNRSGEIVANVEPARS